MTEDDLLRGAREEGRGWEEAPDLTSLSEKELRGRLEELVEEERRVSYRRRVLQCEIDLVRAEIVRRGEAVLSSEELARVLLDSESHEAPSRRGGDD
jgi:hypothetical protein